MNWFRNSEYMTFRFVRKTSLQLQILLINAVGLLNLVGSSFDWGWLKGDLQLKKIWELSALQSDSSEVKDIEWIKTVLSHIIVLRLIINSITLVAHVANIYTILTRDRQNLLILWMVLSFLKDILLEVVVVIVTIILWHNGCITTSLLVEFIIKKAMWLAFSTWKWCTTLSWYMQLQKMAKIREVFDLITRRSNIILDTARKAGHSMDDASLDIAIGRRGKYVSLLSLDDLSDDSSNRVKFNRVCYDLRISKSLTTLVASDSYDTNSTNDYDSISNDLSVAEKSMKMLDITAEDVMDARARIQERSYWEERDAAGKLSNPVEKMMMYFPLENDGKETDEPSGNRRTLIEDKKDNEVHNNKEAVSSEKEDATKHFPMERKTEESIEDNIVSQDGRNEIFIERQEETVNKQIVIDNKEGNNASNNEAMPVSSEEENTTKRYLMEKKKEKNSIEDNIVLGDRRNHILTVSFPPLKNENIASDKANDHENSMKSRNFYTASREKKEETSNATETARCSVNQHEANAKSCPSPAEKVEMKLCSIPENHEWIGEADQRKHPCRVEMKPISVVANENRRDHFKSSSPACHCDSSININAQQNKEISRPAKDKNTSNETDRKKLKCFTSNVVAREDEPNGSAVKQPESRSKKSAQTCRECLEQPVAWNSVSLAQTVLPSGYEKRSIAPNKSSARRKDSKDAQTEISNESKDSVNRRHGWKNSKQMQHIQTSSVSLANNFESFKKGNPKRKEREIVEALEAYDLVSLEDDRQMKIKKRFALSRSPKLSIEEREAIELRALRAYNEQTLLEDKRELEARKKYDSLKILQDPEAKNSKAHSDAASLENKKETITENDSSANYKLTTEQPEVSDHDSIVGRKYDLSTFATSSAREKNIKIPTRASDRPSEADSIFDRPLETGITSRFSKTRDNVNSDSNLSDNTKNRYLPLNLVEVTRNIEWSPHPRGIVLINKSLQGEVSEGGKSRESQQRDIVDNNTASVLHNAFFFRPEILMRIFRRARTTLVESSSNFETSRRGDFNVNFICRVNNETNVPDRNSLPDFNFNRIPEARNNLSRPLFLNANSSHIAGEENGHDLCIIFIGREEFPSESETAIVEDPAEPRRNARFSTENTQTASILVLDTNSRQTDNATNDNLPVQFVISVLRNFGIEVSEESIRDASIERTEEHGDLSGVSLINGFPSHIFHTNDTSYNGESNNICDHSSLSQSIYNNDTAGDENKPISYSSNASNNLDVESSFKPLARESYNLQDEKYANATDIYFEGNQASKNNLSFVNVNNTVKSRSSNFDDDDNRHQSKLGMLINKTEENRCNLFFENFTEVSSAKRQSFIESYHCQKSILKSCDEELQKSTQLSDKQASSGNERKRSISNSRIKNDRVDDAILRSQNVESLRFITAKPNSVKNEDENKNICGRTNEFLPDQFPKTYSSDESDFNSLYEKNTDWSEPTLNEGSLMEEFSNDTVSPTTLSNIDP